MTRFIVGTCAAAVAIAAVVFAGETAAPPAGAVKGTVRADGPRAATNVVVYLEPEDAGAPVPIPAEKPVVRQKKALFDPTFLVCARGQSVRMENDEEKEIDHNVYSISDAKSFDMGLFGPGQGREIVMDRVGEIPIFCSIHKYMEMTVYVAPTPWFAVVPKATAEAAPFAIPAVAPGRYRLRTWHSSKRFKEFEGACEVRAGETAQSDVTLVKR